MYLMKYERLFTIWHIKLYYYLSIAIDNFSDIHKYGCAPVYRKTLDGWSDGMFIPEPNKRLPGGILLGWEVFARRTGYIYLQVCDKNDVG